jgi:hypothetical protein
MGEPGGRGERSSTKKAPPDCACLDEDQVLPIGGARSRNHKKMGCPASHCAGNLFTAQEPALGALSGPQTNVFAICHAQQVPSGTKCAFCRQKLISIWFSRLWTIALGGRMIRNAVDLMLLIALDLWRGWREPGLGAAELVRARPSDYSEGSKSASRRLVRHTHSPGAHRARCVRGDDTH